MKKAIKDQGRAPHTITLDGYEALHRAVREMKTGGFLPEDTNVRSSTYLNNMIEQHNRNVKSRANVMLGFKRFSFAAVVITGVELAYRIRKEQIDFAELGFKENYCARRLGGRPCPTMK